MSARQVERMKRAGAARGPPGRRRPNEGERRATVLAFRRRGTLRQMKGEKSQTMKKQFIAKLLVLCLVLTMLPVAAFASDNDITPFTATTHTNDYEITGDAAVMSQNVNLGKDHSLTLNGPKTLTTNDYTLSVDTVYVVNAGVKIHGSEDGKHVGTLEANKIVVTPAAAKLDVYYVNLPDVTTIELADNGVATKDEYTVKIHGGVHGTLSLGKGVYALLEDCYYRAITGEGDYELINAKAFSGSSSSGSSGGSGGGGGGGGASTPSTPSTPSTTTGDDTTVTVKATVKDGVATAAISAETANKAVADAITEGSNNIVFSVTDVGDAKKVEVTLPAASAKDVASKTSASVVVESPVATVTLSNAAVSELSSKATANVGVTAEKNDDGTTTVTVLVDSKPVDSVSGVKAALPVTSEQAATQGTVVVLVNADGTETIIKKSALKDGAIVAALKNGTSKLKVVDNSKTFADAPTQSWAKSAMDFVSSRELFQGVSATQFAPNSPMNRAMLVTVLYRLEDATSKGGAAFADVTSGTWYSDAVGWATQAGITNGTGKGFNPNGEITRQDLATMLYRYAKSIGMDTTASGSTASFSDSGSVSGYASQAMTWAVGNGIINGSNGRLMPTANATRAEVSAMLMRLVGNM